MDGLTVVVVNPTISSRTGAAHALCLLYKVFV